MKHLRIIISLGLLLFLAVFWNRLDSILPQQELFSELPLFLPRIVLVIILFIIFQALHYVLRQVITRQKKLRKLVNQQHLLKISTFTLWTVYTIISLSILINDFTGLLASIGLIGFGLTIALQKPISNFVGWLTILFKGIYKEGDRIQIGTIRGDVKEIQLMNTVLENLLEGSDIKDKKIVTFPNEYVLTQEVKNYTKEENYILSEIKIRIHFTDNYQKATTILEKSITEYIQANQQDYQTTKKRIPKGEFTPRIRLEFDDSGIILIGHFLTPYDKIRMYKSAIYSNFLEAIKKERDIKIAYKRIHIQS